MSSLHRLLAEKLVLSRPGRLSAAPIPGVLLERIAIRDREYERNMDRGYLEALNVAYADFYRDYTGPRF